MKNLEEHNSKRKKDQFSVTIIGIIIYSMVLIFVMAGTYVGVKSILKNHEAKLAAAEEAIIEEPPVEEVVEPIEVPEPEAVIEIEEDELNEHMVDLSSVCDSNTRYIDYNQTFFEPPKRDKNLVWNDSVFSRIENTEQPQESLVNTYDYKRVYGYLLDGTKVVFEIYTNPETELIEKIRTVSHGGDGVEVITYYYNLGNINYITHYAKGIDTPINIASGDVESRYYFSKDEMVKYVYCSNNEATEYVVEDIDTYSEGTVENYNYMEGKMLNYAYINYNIAKVFPESVQVSGYILDEFNQPLKGATVKLIKSTDNEQLAETSTNDDGVYSIEIDAINDSDLYLDVSDYTLCGAKVYHIKAVSGSGEVYPEPVYMSYEGNVQEYNLQILVRDATDMSKALPSADFKIRNGLNNTDGEVIYNGSLNEAGAIIVPIRAGCYTAEVTLGGYENAIFNLVVKQDHQAILGYAVPDLGDDTIATVLSWDTTPLDLDARIISSNAKREMKSPIDSIGSTTPEVIYIDNAGTDDYEYYVSDYTAATAGDPLAYNLSSSNANVLVYNSEGFITSIHVPLAHGGIVWDVMKIRNKKVIPINHYYYNLEANSYWTSK